MSSHKGPPEGAEVVDFQELRAAIEAAIADSRRLHETSKEDPTLTPNAGIVELIDQTNYLSLGQTLPHQAALMAEWLRKPNSQTELIKFLKRQFLNDQLITVLQLVLDANFDAERINQKIPDSLPRGAILIGGVEGLVSRRRVTKAGVDEALS